MTEWFSLDDLAAWGLPGYRVSRRRLAVMVDEQGWREKRDPRLGALARRRTGKGGGWEYHRACLSVPAQKILAEKSALGGGPVGGAPPQGAFTSAGSVQQSKAEARAALVRAADRFRAAQGLPQAASDNAFIGLYQSNRVDVPAWIREIVPSASIGSLRRWRKRLRRGGLGGLVARHGQHRKGSGLIDRQPALVDLIKGMLASYPHAGAGHIMQALRARFGENDGITLPSPRGLQRWLAAWKAAHPQLHAALVDPDKARSQYLAAVGNASENVSRLNQLWELDSSPGDIILADGQRHALIGVIDVYSRRLKLQVAQSSSTRGIAAVMRRAILDWGVPEAVKTDNGKDYTSRHMTRLLDSLGIEHKICPPFSPEKKPHIERAFGTFTRDLLELLPGFTGHSVAERQGVRNRQGKNTNPLWGTPKQDLNKPGGTPAGEYKNGRPQTVIKSLTPQEFQQFCDRWCDDVYAHNAHGGLNGVTPFARAAQFNGAVRKIENERALDIALMPPPTGSEWRVVGKRGVSVSNGFYIHPELAAFMGRRVRVALDDADFGAIYLFDEDGQFICRAEDAATLGADRREVAHKTKQKQKEIVNQGLKELRKTAKQVKAQEILTVCSSQADGLAAFPSPIETHDSPGLLAAEQAAQTNGSPVGVPPLRVPHGSLEPKVIAALSAEDQAAADALFARLNGDDGAGNDNVITLSHEDPANPSWGTRRGGTPKTAIQPNPGAPQNGHKNRPIFEDDAAFVEWAQTDEAATEADQAYAAELLSKSPTLRLLATR